MSPTFSPRYSVSSAASADERRSLTSSTTATFAGLGFSIVPRLVGRPKPLSAHAHRMSAAVEAQAGYYAAPAASSSMARRRLGSILMPGPIVEDSDTDLTSRPLADAGLAPLP